MSDHGVVEHLVLFLGQRVARDLRFAEQRLHVGSDMPVAKLPVSVVLTQQTLHRRGGNHRDVNRPFPAASSTATSRALLRNILIADLHVEHSDDGIFADLGLP